MGQDQQADIDELLKQGADLIHQSRRLLAEVDQVLDSAPDELRQVTEAQRA
jgi:hypothetical protein